MSVFHNNMLVGASQPSGAAAFDTTLVPKSIFFEGQGTSGDSMTRTSTTPDNRNRWLFGTWYQPLRSVDSSSDRMTIFAAGSASAGFYLRHDEDDLQIFHRDEDGTEGSITTSGKFRDTTTWYHIMVDYNSANSISQDRISLYLNGVRVGTNNSSRPGQNKCVLVNTEGEIERIGMDFSTTPGNAGSFYLAQTFLMDNKSIDNGDHAITDFLDTFTFGTNGSQVIPKSNDDIKALVAAAGPNSFYLNYEDTTDKGSVDGMTRDRKATESTNHVAGITPTLSEGIQGGALANVTNGQRSRGALETNTTSLTLLFDLGSGNEQAVQSVSFTTEGTTSFANDAGQGGGSQSNGRIKDLTISGSNNGTDFTTLSSSTVAQKRSNALHVVSWSNTTAYRYLKFANANIYGGLRSNVGGLGFHTEQSPVIGNDFWGDKNHSTSSGASEINQDHQSGNTPSLVCAKFNPLDYVSNAGTLGKGNTEFATGGNDSLMALTLPVIETGCYWEAKVTNAGDEMFGLWANSTRPLRSASTSSPHQDAAAFVIRIAGNGLFVAGSDQGFTSAGISTNDVLMFAYKDGQFFYGKNGNWENSADPEAETGELFTISNSSTRIIQPVFGRAGSSNVTYEIKMKVEEWTHTATKPSWGAAINSANSPAPDFQGIDYFDTTLYEGNGQNQRVGDFVPFTDTYTVDKSAMFDDGNRRYLARTYTASDTARSSNSQATISYWIKFCSAGANQDILTTSNSGQTDRLRHYINDQSGQESIYMTLDGPSTNRDFEIPISKLSEQEWTNIVYNIDVDNSTAADKIKCWVNGVQQTSTDTSYQSASNADYFLFDNEEHFIGNLAPASAGYTVFCLNSYLAEMHVLDGQLKPPTDFGQVDTSTNRWVPKDYKTNVGAYGNRGFYMAFDNASGTGDGVGTDSSGNGFHFTESFVSGGSDWATTDQFVDTPSKNFVTFDTGYLGGSSNVFSEGNTRVKGTDGSNSDTAVGTFGMTGKIVVDFKFHTVGGGYPKVGFITGQEGLDDINKSSGSIEIGTFQVAGSIAFGSSGSFYIPTFADSTQITSGIATGQSVDADDVIRYEVDTVAGTVRVFFQNEGTGSFTEVTAARIDNFSFDPVFGVRPVVSNYNNSEVSMLTGGQASLSSVSTDFLEMNQDNLDATASKLTAFAWIKNRDAADNHMFFDRVRGIGKDLHSNSQAAEATNASTVQRFLQRGVQVGNNAEVNTATESYVLWQWLLGDSATTGSTNSDGSVDTTVIAADAGHFSVVKGTTGGSGATFGHGLGAAPDLIINKDLNNSSSNWLVYNSISGASFYLALNSSGSINGPGSTVFGTEPDSTVFTLGSFFANVECINYCFRSVPGVCKVGSYVGNNNADGSYVHTGFKPAFVMTKTTSSGAWGIMDSAREPSNPVIKRLFPSSNSAEDEDGEQMDFLSKGFKLRKTGGFNNNNQTYIYLAMAEISGNGTLPPIYGR